MNLMVFTIARGERIAEVCEDGSVNGDPDLCGELRERLREPVTVYAQGTVAPPPGKPASAVELRPGDGRYVVARIRTLCAPGSEYRVAEVDWR